MEVPAGSKILVLQAHPDIIKKNIGLYEVNAPQNSSLVWPSDIEAVPDLRRNARFLGEKCTLRKYGDPVTVDRIVVRINFPAWGPYNLVADPLESTGTFSEFTFYMINYCYLEPPPPGTMNMGEGPLVLGTFPTTATLHILGQSQAKEVPITIPFRQSLSPNFLLPITHRRWNGVSPSG